MPASAAKLHELLRTTRAVRRLRADPVPDAVLRRVLEAATWAPSGGNRQPWRMILVRETARRRALQALYAPLWRRYAGARRPLLAALPEPARGRAARQLDAGDELAATLHRVPALVVFCFEPQALHVTDAESGRVPVVGGASLYPAVQNLLLACRAEGLGCVLTTLLCQAEAEVRELLEIPEPWATHALVPIGWPRLAGHGPLRRAPLEAMAFAETWGTPLPAGGGPEAPPDPPRERG